MYMCMQAQAYVEARGPLRVLFLRCCAPSFIFLRHSPLLSWNLPSRIGCVTDQLAPGICLSPACQPWNFKCRSPTWSFFTWVLGIEVAASTLPTELFPSSTYFPSYLELSYRKSMGYSVVIKPKINTGTYGSELETLAHYSQVLTSLGLLSLRAYPFTGVCSSAASLTHPANLLAI